MAKLNISDNQGLALLEGLKRNASPHERLEARKLLRKLGFVPANEKKRKTGPDSNKNKPEKKERETIEDIVSVLGSNYQLPTVLDAIHHGLTGLRGFHKQCLRGFFLPPDAVMAFNVLAARRSELRPVLSPWVAKLNDVPELTADDFFAGFKPAQKRESYRNWTARVRVGCGEAAAYFGIRPKARLVTLVTLRRFLQHARIIVDGSRYVNLHECGTAYAWARFSRSEDSPLSRELSELSILFEAMSWNQRVAPFPTAESLSYQETLERVRMKLGLSVEGDVTGKVERMLQFIENFEHAQRPVNQKLIHQIATHDANLVKLIEAEKPGTWSMMNAYLSNVANAERLDPVSSDLKEEDMEEFVSTRLPVDPSLADAASIVNDLVREGLVDLKTASLVLASLPSMQIRSDRPLPRMEEATDSD